MIRSAYLPLVDILIILPQRWYLIFCLFVKLAMRFLSFIFIGEAHLRGTFRKTRLRKESLTEYRKRSLHSQTFRYHGSRIGTRAPLPEAGRQPSAADSHGIRRRLLRNKVMKKSLPDHPGASVPHPRQRGDIRPQKLASQEKNGAELAIIKRQSEHENDKRITKLYLMTHSIRSNEIKIC